MTNCEVAIITFDGAGRLPLLLASLLAPEDMRVTVYEDPSWPDASDRTDSICNEYGVCHVVAPEWSNMQGMARLALDQCEADWMILLSDDVVFSPTCLNFLVEQTQQMHEMVVAFNVPAHQAQDVFPDGDHAHMYDGTPYTINDLIWPGTPCLYINVHGSGFVVRADAWRAVGGPSRHTWCYDEDLAVKIWLWTPWAILATGGPAMIHYGGAAQNGRLHPEQDAHTIEAWLRDWPGQRKEELDWMLRRAMSVKGKLLGIPAR